MINMPCFVINLATNHARMRSIQTGLSRAAISFERIDAVDGRSRSGADFPEYDRALGKRLYGRKISGPEAACFLSHREAAARFLETGAEAGLILEDDAVIPERFEMFLNGYLDWLAQEFAGQWDIVNLGRGATGPFTPLPFKLSKADDSGLGVCHAYPLVTTGLIWSRAGAARFLQASDRIYAPVDQFLCDHLASNSRGLGFLSPPIRASDAPSDINYRLWQRILDTRNLGALLTKQRRLRRNAELSRASKAGFRFTGPLSNQTL